MTGPSLPLVLASSSPRRRELLARLGLAVSYAVPEVDESRRPGEPPAVHVQRIASAKARAAAALHPHAAVLAADTSVVLGDEVFGKPRHRADAARILFLLRGRAHTVLTATTLMWSGQEVSHLEAATVTFANFSDELLHWYVATGEGDDKAGAYAVQGKGAILVARVEGNVQGVVGLPLARLPGLFAALGLRLQRQGEGLVVRPAGEPTLAPPAG